MLDAGRGHLPAAPEAFSAAHQSRMVGSHVVAPPWQGWRLATQARLGMTDAARTALASVPDEHAGNGEVRNARAVIELIDGDLRKRSRRCGSSLPERRSCPP